MRSAPSASGDTAHSFVSAESNTPAFTGSSFALFTIVFTCRKNRSEHAGKLRGIRISETIGPVPDDPQRETPAALSADDRVRATRDRGSCRAPMCAAAEAHQLFQRLPRLSRIERRARQLQPLVPRFRFARDLQRRRRALTATMSRAGPRSPFKMRRIISALASASSARNAPGSARGMPNFSTSSCTTFMTPSCKRATVVGPNVETLIQMPPALPAAPAHDQRCCRRSQHLQDARERLRTAPAC